MPVPRGRRDAQGFHLGPKASVEFDLGGGFAVLGAYGNGFRSPQALSLGQGENAPFATVHAGEVGMRFRGRAGSATVAAYATHVDRDLVFEPSVGQNIPAGATTRLGAAAAVRFVPVSGVVVLASGAYARATFDETGLLVPYVPTLVGRLDATATRQAGTVRGLPLTLSAGVGASFIGLRPLPFSERADAVFLLDLGGSVRLGPLELSLSARNLTDARWRDGEFNYPSNFDPSEVASLVPARHFTAGRPFTLLTSLTAHL
jgi:outer membrane receptor protein involved in Fe transport